MVSYEPLWKSMKEKNITTYALINKYGFSSRTIFNLKHNKGINVFTLEKLCDVIGGTPNDVLCFEKKEEADKK